MTKKNKWCKIFVWGQIYGRRIKNENNDTLNHKSYCICSEYSVEHHNYQDFETGYKCINCNFYTEGPIINYDNYDLIVDDVLLVRKEEEYEN